MSEEELEGFLQDQGQIDQQRGPGQSQLLRPGQTTSDHGPRLLHQSDVRHDLPSPEMFGQ